MSIIIEPLDDPSRDDLPIVEDKTFNEMTRNDYDGGQNEESEPLDDPSRDDLPTGNNWPVHERTREEYGDY